MIRSPRPLLHILIPESDRRNSIATRPQTPCRPPSRRPYRRHSTPTKSPGGKKKKSQRTLLKYVMRQKQSITQLESRSEIYSSGLSYLRPSPRPAATFAPPTARAGERHGDFFSAPSDPGPVHVACQAAGAAAVPETSPIHFQCTYRRLLH